MIPASLDAVRVPAWAWTLLALAAFTVLFALQANDVVMNADKAMWLHEITHDARHALGVPCH